MNERTNERTNERMDDSSKRTRQETREANGADRSGAGRPADLRIACMRARTRVRACMHFHRRALRNCKVAYMQGVKLRGCWSFDPRGSRGRSAREDRRDIDPLQQRILAHLALPLPARAGLLDEYRPGTIAPLTCTLTTSRVPFGQ